MRYVKKLAIVMRNIVSDKNEKQLNLLGAKFVNKTDYVIFISKNIYLNSKLFINVPKYVNLCQKSFKLQLERW